MDRGGIGGHLLETDPRDTVKGGTPITSTVPAAKRLDSYRNRKFKTVLNSEAREVFKLNGHVTYLISGGGRGQLGLNVNKHL